MLFPVINAVSKALPKSKQATNAPTLSYCDLEKLPHHVVSNICDWLHIGVLMLGRFRGEGFGKDWLLPVDATLVLLATQNVDVNAPFFEYMCMSEVIIIIPVAVLWYLLRLVGHLM